MKNILITIDFENNDQVLIDKGFELANAFGSKVWLVHIAAPDPDFVGYEVGPQYIRDSRASELREEHKRIQNHADKLIKKGIDAEGILIQGSTIEMVLDEAKKLEVDLIIAGHHDRSFLYKAFIGSVSSEIVNESQIPVLIVPIK